MRRHCVESVNARWGNLQAILAGDYLLAKASEIAASISAPRSPGCSPPPSAGCARARSPSCSDAFNADRTEERYFRSIAGKTAALFATACRIGGIVGGLARDRDRRPHRPSAQSYGMAFQIVDDVLDVVATDEELGKPTGHDLRRGHLHAAGDPGPGGAARRRPADAARQAARRRSLARALDLVRADDAVSTSIEAARAHAERAIAALGPAASTESGAWLVETAEALLDRVASRA